MRGYARLYLLVPAAGAPLILLNHSLGSILRGEGAARQGMLGGLVATAANIVLDISCFTVVRSGMVLHRVMLWI